MVWSGEIQPFCRGWGKASGATRGLRPPVSPVPPSRPFSSSRSRGAARQQVGKALYALPSLVLLAVSLLFPEGAEGCPRGEIMVDRNEKSCTNLQGCNAICCRGFYVDLQAGSPDYKNYLELHGYVPDSRGRIRIWISAKCSALTEENLCSLYGKPERPKICQTSCCKDDAKRELIRINCLKAASN